VRTLKILIYTAETANEDTLHKRIFYVSQTVHNRPSPLKGSWPSWSDMYRLRWFRWRTFGAFVV